MSTVGNRELLRAVLKNDLEKLGSYIADGHSISKSTESENWNLLHQAMLNPHLYADADTITFLVNNGVNPNQIDVYGNTPLHYASSLQDTGCMRVLLEAGVSVDIVNNEYVTPLKETLLRPTGNFDATKLLLEYGADPDFRANENSVREFAAQIAHGELVELRQIFGLDNE